MSPRFGNQNIVSYTGLSYNQQATVVMNKNGATINGTYYQIGSVPAQLNLSTYNFLLFTMNNTGSVDSRYFTGKLYSCKLYNNGVLVRNYIPCYRKIDRVVGLYDTVNDVFYVNAGTGEFKRGTIVDIPNAFQEVEYIESSGTQYIDTQLVPANSTKITTKIEVVNTLQDQPVFGTCLPVESTSLGNYYHLTPYNNKWYYGGNGTEGNGGIYTPIVGTTYEIAFNNSGSILINGSQIASGITFGTKPNANLYISRRGSFSNSNYRIGAYKYYYFNIYDNGGLVRDFIPVYRKSDNVIGLYDLVNGVFYTNAGTGTFTKGSNIEWELLKMVKQHKRFMKN